METFDHVWLTLREPVDHRSRPQELVSLLRSAWGLNGWSRVVDLGSGTGSNARYLATHLPSVQEWTLVERDPAHADRLERWAPPGGGHRRVRRDDLADGLMAVLDAADLVTASALLDLVSESWLARLVDACVAARRGALFALSYSGEIRWLEPATGRLAMGRDDRLVQEAVNRDQRRDKGFGPALGPQAGMTAERLFVAAGYRTWLRPSPWRLGSMEAPLVDRLIDGWAAVAAHHHPEAEERWARWADDRRSAVSEGRCLLEVGHVDLLALPGESS